MTRTRTTRYVTLLSVVLALALTAALAACGSDEPSGVTGPGGTASTPTETPVSPAQTPTTTGSGVAPTTTDAPAPATATAPARGLRLRRNGPGSDYNATDGENWASTNWLSDAPLGQWFSVITNDDGRVTGLELCDNESGEIPAELGSLSNLTGWSLNDNDLSGEMPAAGQPLQPGRPSAEDAPSAWSGQHVRRSWVSLSNLPCRPSLATS